MDALLAQDVVPQVQRDQAHLQLAQAESQVAMATASLQEVETAGSYASIRAPFAGEVVGRYIDRGRRGRSGHASPGGGGGGPPGRALGRAGARSGGLGGRVHDPGDHPGWSGFDAPVRVVAAGADPMSKTVEVRVTLPADWPTGVSVTALVPAGDHPGRDHSQQRLWSGGGQLTGVRVVTPDGVALRWIRLGRAVDEEPGGSAQRALTRG